MERPKTLSSKPGAFSGAVSSRNDEKRTETGAVIGAVDSDEEKSLNEKTQGNLGDSLVVRGGLEPPTHGFSVRCSTN